MNTTKQCRFCKEDILKEAVVCKHCGKKQTVGVGTRIGQFFIFLIVLGVISSFIIPKSDTGTTTTPTQAEQKINVSDALKQSLTVLSKPYTFDRSMISKTVGEVKTFNNTAGVIKMGEASSNPEDQKLAKQLKEKLVSIQMEQFPAIRKAYGELSGKAVWEENITVTVSGQGGTILTLAGGAFASNKNIGDTHKVVGPIAELLRFKRVNYKFIPSDPNYQYYDIDSPKDGEIVSQNP
jgi:hypothetical protein